MLQESPKECHEATVPTEVPDDVKAECGDLEVVYVKSVDCPAGIEHSINNAFISSIYYTNTSSSSSSNKISSGFHPLKQM
jgi:hypothetical protein